MQQAVKRNAAEFETDLDGQALIPSNDLTGQPSGRDINELKEKIKTARLEKMMARELEAELSIDQIEFEEPTPQPANTDEVSLQERLSNLILEGLEKDARPAPEDPAPTQIGSTDTHLKSELMDSMRRFEELADNVRNNSRLFVDLSEEASGLVEYLQGIERDLVLLDQTREELKQLNRSSERTELQWQEAQETIERQQKKIELMETMRKSSLEDQESVNRQLTKLQFILNEKSQEVLSLEEDIANSECEKDALKEKLQMLDTDLLNSDQNLDVANNKLIEKDRRIAKLTTELSAMTDQATQNEEKFALLRKKYNDLNKRGLEQKSEHYNNMHEIEAAVRELKRQLKANKQEKAELAVELNATSNLLTLHEEMIAELSLKKA
ncbi:MAG: hypothetical protein AAF423_08435 [Pseudomonadota bacterium]